MVIGHNAKFELLASWVELGEVSFTFEAEIDIGYSVFTEFSFAGEAAMEFIADLQAVFIAEVTFHGVYARAGRDHLHVNARPFYIKGSIFFKRCLRLGLMGRWKGSL